jgi:hypothetical protein
VTPRVFVLLFSTMPSACRPNFLFNMFHVLAYVSSEWAVRISSQSLDLVVEYDNAVMEGCLSEVSGTDNVVAFLAKEPRDSGSTRDVLAKEAGKPWDSSNDRESRTTEVHRRLRSLDVVSSCLPSSP